MYTWSLFGQVASASAADVVTRPAQEGLVFPQGPPGSWDEAGVGSPVVSGCSYPQLIYLNLESLAVRACT